VNLRRGVDTFPDPQMRFPVIARKIPDTPIKFRSYVASTPRTLRRACYIRPKFPCLFPVKQEIQRRQVRSRLSAPPTRLCLALSQFLPRSAVASHLNDEVEFLPFIVDLPPQPVSPSAYPTSLERDRGHTAALAVPDRRGHPLNVSMPQAHHS
jgi:hypothetical protein